MTRPTWFTACLLVAALSVLTAAQQSGQRPSGQTPRRDTPAQPQSNTPEPEPKGRISGRVLALDTGRPVKRARVFATAAQLPQGRAVLTDDSGEFDLTGLPEGRYTLSVSKTGFIILSYGQRRPLQAGTPLQLAGGQELRGVEFRLPRGGAITGHVLDESGDPMPGALVSVMRYQYVQGARQLVPAGAGPADDRGEFRVWGLNPGDYYVSATMPSLVRSIPGPAPGDTAGGRGGRGAGAAGGTTFSAGTARGLMFFAGGQAESESVGYAPTYFPGVPSVNEARPVTIGLGSEVRDVDFRLLLVTTSRLAGRVTNADGSAVTAGTVSVSPESQPGRGGMLGMSYNSRIQWDGGFSIVNVPPGRYTLRARATDSDRPTMASQSLTVLGDVSDLSIILLPGATITGTVTLQTTQSPTVPDASQLRVTIQSLEGGALGVNPMARVEKDGTFKLENVPSGPLLLRAQAPKGWALKSVVADGRDVVDTPFDLRSGQRLSGVALTFTDRLSAITGTISDDHGQPVTEYTVLAFPTDEALWRPQARQIMTARPDQNGAFELRGLPAGDYFLATVDPTEQGEWFEPAFLEQQRARAARLLLGDGDVKTQDFRVTVK